VEARLAEKLAEGAIQTPFSVLGELTSTRNDLSILLGYILNLRFDASLLRAYRAIIDDYVAFWEDAVEQENLAIKDSESGSRSSLDAHSGEGDHGFRRMATT